MTRQRKNVAASVKQRLLNLSRESGEEFNLVLIRYGIERMLYRLSQSAHADDFVLKGAMLFHLFADAAHRPTRDVDLLSRGEPDLDRFQSIFVALCKMDVEDDGLEFNARSVRAARIRDDAEYEGIRVQIVGRLETARITLQIDIGFGDAITPRPRKQVIPGLLDFPPPRLRIYPWETVVAEKYQAMVELGMTNSRMKDFFDLQHLANRFEFDGVKLSKAIQATFKRRNTDLPETIPIALTPKFTEDAAVRTKWTAFLRRSRLDDSAFQLKAIAEAIWRFLEPINSSLRSPACFDKKWQPGGPWRK